MIWRKDLAIVLMAIFTVVLLLSTTWLVLRVENLSTEIQARVRDHVTEEMGITSSVDAGGMQMWDNTTTGCIEVAVHFSVWGPIDNAGMSVYPGIITVRIFLDNWQADFFTVSQETNPTVWKTYPALGSITVRIENPSTHLSYFAYTLYTIA
jgi:hypothetical protein